MRRGLVLLMVLTVTVAIHLPYADEAPPPERIVRASFADEDTSYLRGDAEEWTSLGLNTPLMTGDALYAGEDAKAEVSLGRGTFARLNGGTQVELVSLTGSVTQLGVDSGQLSLRVGAIPEGGIIEVDTPSASATIDEPGLYKISADDEHGLFEAVSGGMSVLLGGEQLDLDEGESLSIAGAEQATYEYGKVRPSGPFDSWVASRDRKFDGSKSKEYVNKQVEGAGDLDDHGSWRPDPTYGRVWVPAGVGPDWAPYQDGRWVWQDPYGWTWVSYEPWGWAPYHYGRWVSVGGSWAWVPPPPAGYVAPAPVIMPEPVYAPALVAFVGGSNWSIGVSTGGPAVGWVPLAPAEHYYYPWQPAPRTKVVYKNVKVVNAVTVVNVNNFHEGGRKRVRGVSTTTITRAPAMGCSPRGISPTRTSLVAYPERHISPRAVPAHRSAKHALVTRLVPPPRPTPFAQKEATIRKTGRPVARPVAYEGDVGKPYHKGARVPKGVNAVSAIAPERPVKVTAGPGGGEHARQPRHIEHDMLPRAGKHANQSGGQHHPGWESNRGVGPDGTPPGQAERGNGAKQAPGMNNRGKAGSGENENGGKVSPPRQQNGPAWGHTQDDKGEAPPSEEGSHSTAAPAPEPGGQPGTRTGSGRQGRKGYVKRARPAPPSGNKAGPAGNSLHEAAEGMVEQPPAQKAGMSGEQAKPQAQDPNQKTAADAKEKQAPKKKQPAKKKNGKKKGKKGKGGGGEE